MRRFSEDSRNAPPNESSRDDVSRFRMEACRAEEALRALEAYWRATDPDFEDKALSLKTYGQEVAEQLLSGRIEPRDVVSLMQDRYDEITRSMRSVRSSYTTH